MSAPRKFAPAEQLQQIEDALVQSILDASGAELRKEISDAGGDPDSLIAEVDLAMAAARSKAAQARLQKARAELSAWQQKSGPVSAPEREAARERFERLQSGTPEPGTKMMMAARKGQGMSATDKESMVEDIAELKRLEQAKDET